jgi:hypothetical protein
VPQLLRQYLYVCTSKASKLIVPQLLRQYLYVCTSKASKLSTSASLQGACMTCSTKRRVLQAPQLRQHLYFCPSKAYKLGAPARAEFARLAPQQIESDPCFFAAGVVVCGEVRQMRLQVEEGADVGFAGAVFV